MMVAYMLSFESSVTSEWATRGVSSAIVATWSVLCVQTVGEGDLAHSETWAKTHY